MKKMLLLFILIWSGNLFAQKALTSQFDSLTSSYEQNNYHGVILVAKGDQILYEKGYGLANFDRKIKNTHSTEFRTESVGKMFTAVCIMQVVEQGRLSLNQTVKVLLPELQLKNADKITVHHLLTHTSGLQSPWDNPTYQFKKVYTKDEMEKIITEMPLIFETPGKEMYYSNSGYIVLGWIIEKISAKPFDQYLQENIFKPLKMSSTRHLMDTVMPIKTGAQPYRILNSKKYVLMNETVASKAGAAGGWVSTPKDLYRFMLALYQNRLIKPETWEIMRTANHTNPKDSAYSYYAYGFQTDVNQMIPGVSLYGHNGGGAGFSIDAFVDPASGYIVTSCTNLYQYSTPIVVNYFKAAFGKPIQPVEQPLSIRIYDFIQSKGIDDFVAHGTDNLQQLGVQPEQGMFVQTGEAMEAAGDYKTWAKWMEFAGTYFPNEGFILVLRGDSQLKAGGDKAMAKKLYEQAKEIGSKNNDQRLVQYVEEKLKAF